MAFTLKNLSNLRYLALGLLTLTFVMSASGFPWKDCDPIAKVNGVYVQNCSDKYLIELPELSDQAEVLDFSGNRFTELPFIGESKECFEEANCHVINTTNHCRLNISFSRNEINRFNESAFHNLRCLRSLDLSFNDIKADVLTVATFMEGLFHVQSLSLRGNPLGCLGDNIITQPFMPELRKLDLSQCQLKEIGKDSVDDLGELRVLDLSYNNLKTIHSDTFKGLNKLEHLDLRHNQLSYFPEHVFGDLKNLQGLHLTDNKVTGFHTDAFYKDSNLLVLALQNNQLTSIPYAAVDKLPKLRTLDLSQNPIKSVAPGADTSNVKNLVMDNLPYLTELESGALSSFSNLVSLSISGNKALKHIHPALLGATTTTLEHVRLQNNGLSTLPHNALPWPQLKSLELGGNSWYCDVRLSWMIHTPAIQDPVICSEPIKLQGHDIRTLADAELMREFPIQAAAAIILFFVFLPLVGVCALLVWKRRRHFRCIKASVKGRYVSVYTRDMDLEGEQRVAIELKVNVNRLNAVSNGSADDTKPFIKMQDKSEMGARDDEEEI